MSTPSHAAALAQTATIDNDTLLLHPSQLNNMKKNVLKELYKKKNKWNDEVKGIITSVTNIKVLNGGRAKVMDCEPHLHYQVRYDISYIRPEIG